MRKIQNIIIPEEWRRLVIKIKERKAPSIIFIIGASDTGKSILAQYIYIQLNTKKGLIALVDADLGQSTVGPPTTVGLAIDKDQKNIFKPLYMQFVGSTSPRGHMLQTLVAVKKLVDKAKALKVKKIIIDTSGFISGVIGHEFKFQKIDLINPTHIIALEMENELGSLLGNFSHRKEMAIHRFKVIKGAIKLKTRDERRFYREKQFKNFFKNAKLKSLNLSKIGIHGIVPDLTIKQNWNNLLLGLCDAENNTLSLSIIQDIDLSKGIISFITPFEKMDNVKSIQFGSMYLDKDGRQL